jgi:hypothetical protein
MRNGLRAGLAAAVMVASVVTLWSGAAEATAPARVALAPLQAPVYVNLPFDSTGGLALDEEHGHVFVNAPGAILVTDLNGVQQVAIAVEPGVTAMFLEPETDSLYLAVPNAAIVVIDTDDLMLRARYSLPGVCPRSVVVRNGVAWIGQRCNSGDEALFSYNLATGEIVGVAVGEGAIKGDLVKPVPGHPDLLALNYPLQIVDISTGTAHVVAAAPSVDVNRDLTVTGDGAYVLSGGQRFRLSDLAGAGSYPKPELEFVVEAGTTAVASASDYNYSYPELLVHRAGEGVTRREYNLPGNIPPGGLAWSADESRLYVIVDALNSETGNHGGARLYILPDAGRRESVVAVSVPRPLPLTGSFPVTGRLSFIGEAYDGQPRTLAVTRTDREGVHTLPDLTTDATGQFAFTDGPTPPGRALYTVSYSGDADRAPVTSSAGAIREVPWDVNGDGYGEVVTGAPGEDIGADITTGQFHVLYGRAAGPTGVGSVAIHQDTAGVPGSNEDGDQFGFAQGSGDFNGDGYADVAVAANAEDVGAATNGGAVTVFYGSATGLRTDNALALTIATAGFPTSDNAYFGDALAAGDFNGDGLDDLAIGADGIGRVFLAVGTTSGLSLQTNGSLGSNQKGDFYGFALAAGDVNGDGRDDLAVGAPMHYDVGEVYVLYGSPTGVNGTGSQFFNKGTPGVPGTPAPFDDSVDLGDSFGWQVALADFSGDAKADLAVSAPGSPITSGGSSRQDAGTFTILYSDGSKIGTVGAVQATQDTAGIPGAPRKGDMLGLTMAAGDSTGDGVAELAVYSADGYVTVVPGGPGGLVFGAAKGWTQDSPSVPGATEAGDAWGASLRFVRPLGAAVPAGLLVGAPGENKAAGAVTFLPAAAGTGLTGAGSKYFSQNSTGIPGGSESGDVFGTFY